MSDSIEESTELKGLKEHQIQIKHWMKKVQQKIFDLETSYLEETAMGNLIKGWEPDGRPPLKSRGQYDEKERLFSYSNRLAYELRNSESQSNKLGNLALNKKKNKKRKLEGGDEYIPGDY